MRSPGRKSKADTAWLKATVAFSTMATFRAAAPTRRPSSSYVSRTRGSASSAASYPPIAASRSRNPVSAWSTVCGMSAAPALLRWIRSRHPGVSRRQRSSSGVGARVGVIIVTKGRGIGPCAQVVVSSFPFPRRRRGPDTALRFKRNVLPGPLFRVGTTKAENNPTSLAEVPYHKPPIRRSPGQHGVGGVHIARFRKRDVRRLVVGALHEPDGGREREQCRQDGRRAAQVGLQACADSRVGGANRLEQLQRRVHVARLLHVDPA